MSTPAPDLSRRLGAVVERGDFVVPPYPAAALRLRSLIESNRFGLSQIADAAAADPALAASLLRIANSPVYRGDGPPLTSLLRAVNRLGARAVSSLALATSVGTEACAPGALGDVKYRCWRRSLSCALAAQRLSSARSLDPEQAFLAGLLHGFGRSVALACIEKLIASSGEAHTLAEWLAFVEEHRAPLAARVARAWQLPESITRAMSADAAADDAMTDLVALADAIADGLDRGLGLRELATALALEQELATRLRTFIEHLPGALEAFLHSEAPRKAAPASSAVNKPASSLTGELRALPVRVVDLRKGSHETFAGVAITPLGIVVTNRRPVQESSVIRLRLESEPTLEAWFNVTLCVPDGQHFRVELQAFAASPELRERLVALWSSAPPLERLREARR